MLPPATRGVGGVWFSRALRMSDLPSRHRKRETRAF